VKTTKIRTLTQIRALEDIEAERVVVEGQLATIQRGLADLADELSRTTDPSRLAELRRDRAAQLGGQQAGLKKLEALENEAASHAARKKAHDSGLARLEERRKLREELQRGAEVLEKLRLAVVEAKAAFPWADSVAHPGGERLRVLDEEIRFDFEEAGLTLRKLEPFPSIDLFGDIRKAVIDLCAWTVIHPDTIGQRGRTARGKARFLAEQLAAGNPYFATQQRGDVRS
jgi:hypothetical protein